MKPDTITIIPTCLIISIWAYRRMDVYFCNRIGVSIYGCNHSYEGIAWRFMKPVVIVGVGVGVTTSILTGFSLAER